MGESKEYRHQTTDLWEAAFLWANGYSPSHAEISEGRQVTLFWPVMGEKIIELVAEYRRGDAKVNPQSYRQGFYHARGLMDLAHRERVG